MAVCVLDGYLNKLENWHVIEFIRWDQAAAAAADAGLMLVLLNRLMLFVAMAAAGLLSHTLFQSASEAKMLLETLTGALFFANFISCEKLLIQAGEFFCQRHQVFLSM